MERIKKLDKLIPLSYLPLKVLLGDGRTYKLKNNSGQPTGIMGANYMKLGNKGMDIAGLIKSDKYMGKMYLVYLVDYKQEICATFVPPPKLTRAQIEYQIGYARNDIEAENKAKMFRQAIKNGIRFYNERNKNGK